MIVTCGHRSRIVTWGRVWGLHRGAGIQGSTVIGLGGAPGQARGTKSQQQVTLFFSRSQSGGLGSAVQANPGAACEETKHHHNHRASQGLAAHPLHRHPPSTRAEVGGTRAQPGYGAAGPPCHCMQNTDCYCGKALITSCPRAVMTLLPEIRTANPGCWKRARSMGGDILRHHHLHQSR